MVHLLLLLLVLLLLLLLLLLLFLLLSLLRQHDSECQHYLAHQLQNLHDQSTYLQRIHLVCNL